MSRKAKRALLGAIALLIVGPLLASWLHYAMTRVDNKYESQFRRSLTEAARAGDTLDLASVADFEWDRLYMFPPYSSRAQMEKAVGSRWTPPVSYFEYLAYSAAHPGQGLVDDSLRKLVFVRDDDVVLDVTLDRSIDFAGSRGMVERGDARYALERAADGRIVAKNAP
jgi:hypothetical protein